MKFMVQKFEKFGWTSKEDSKPALAKLIKIADYPVSSRPRLAEDDDAFFEEDEDGIRSMKPVILPGDEKAEEGAGGSAEEEDDDGFA